MTSGNSGATERLLELAARCEAATGPDRKLDAKIAKAVGRYGSVVMGSDSVTFTHSLDAAMTLVPEGWDWLINAGRNYAHVWEQEAIGERSYEATAPTPALALTAAALRARGEAK